MNNQHDYIGTLIKNKVTLIIPLYNKVYHIEKTLQSVKDIIKYDNFECIVIDDESTDGSSEIAWNFCKENKEIFKYVKIQHEGGRNPANARNVGIKLADSEYICFLDADDLLLSDYITRGVNHFSILNIDIYIENTMVIDNNYPAPVLWLETQDLSKDLIKTKDILLNNIFPYFGSCLYKTSIVKKYNFKDYQSEDMLFLGNYLFHTNNAYANIEETAMQYNIL